MQSPVNLGLSRSLLHFLSPQAGAPWREPRPPGTTGQDQHPSFLPGSPHTGLGHRTSDVCRRHGPGTPLPPHHCPLPCGAWDPARLESPAGLVWVVTSEKGSASPTPIVLPLGPRPAPKSRLSPLHASQRGNGGIRQRLWEAWFCPRSWGKWRFLLAGVGIRGSVRGVRTGLDSNLLSACGQVIYSLGASVSSSVQWGCA